MASQSRWSSTSQTPTPPVIHQQLLKLTDPDADIRFMSLTDLFDMIGSGPGGILTQDINLGAKVVDGLLKSLDDGNGEVQNLAIKGFGPFVTKLHSDLWAPTIERVSILQMQNSIDSSVPCTTLKMIVENLPKRVSGVPDSELVRRAYDSISKVLLVRLIGQRVLPSTRKLPTPPKGLLYDHDTTGVDAEALELLIEVIRGYGPMLHELEVQALQKKVIEIAESSRTSSPVKKKAILANSIITVYMNSEALDNVVATLVTKFQSSHIQPLQRRILLTLTGSLARTIPSRIGVYLSSLAPHILNALSKEELDHQLEAFAESGEPDVEQDEVCEAALSALEGCLAASPQEMKPFTSEIIGASLRYLAYDPSFESPESGDEMDQDHDDEDFMDDFDVEEGFEQEVGMTDDEDATWKVRRCAAKAISTLISTRASLDLLEDGTLYDRIAPTLVASFKEREENVRLEILATTSLLIQKTRRGASKDLGSAVVTNGGSFLVPPTSRKRRRGGSDVSMFDGEAAHVGYASDVHSPHITADGPRASLAALTPSIVKNSIKLLKLNSIPTKQSVIILLKNLVAAQRGGLTDYLSDIIPILSEATGTTSGSALSQTVAHGGISTTGSTLKMEALQLIGALCETHTTAALSTHFNKLVLPVLNAINDKYSKTSCEALSALEQIIRALTPPRLQAPDSIQASYLDKTFTAIVSLANASDADVEVRAVAIHDLGVLLSRTSGEDGKKFISTSKRSEGLEVLKLRLQNEVTRVAAVRAVDEVAILARTADDFSSSWIRSVTIELSAQLRKSNRILRTSSLSALKSIVTNVAGSKNLDKATTKELINNLLPSLDATDLQASVPVLICLVKLVQLGKTDVVHKQLSDKICELARIPLKGQVLEATLALTKEIGLTGSGQSLMQGLLSDVGINGDPSIVGRLIGTLLVNGGPKIGVSMSDFEKEIRAAADDHRVCLALCVLGEAGLLMGSKSSVSPDIFTSHFKSTSERVPLAAATALGRAGAGDIPKYLPTILSGMTATGSSQYLSLHSVKEVLQQANYSNNTSIHSYLPQVWDNLLKATQSDENKIVGAECIGRLALLEPKTYVPAMSNLLSDSNAVTRSMVIQAIRYFLADADDSYDEVLRPVLVPSLRSMLTDNVLDNKRLALTTLNAATHNKPELIFPQLDSLLPLVMAEAHINQSLIREVQMGPFKHKVDDGLEVRKSAYETLYALMETAFSQLDMSEFYDRIVAGLDDENDIRALCSLILTKLITLDPEETSRRLDAIASQFRKILSFKPKDNAVKQEVEKANEARKGAVRVSLLLNTAFAEDGGSALSSGSQQQPGWKPYWDWLKKEFGDDLKAAANVSKARQD